MIHIDWNKAPDWADHAGLIDASLLSGGLDNGLIWFNAAQFCRMNCERQRPFPWGNLAEGGARNNPSANQVRFKESRPAPWNGEGNPPTGAVIEMLHVGCSKWQEITSLHIGTKLMLFERYAGEEVIEEVLPLSAIQLRRIRTAEQIEVDERECALTDMCVLLGKDPGRPGVREKAGVLYDAGYRKQVAP